MCSLFDVNWERNRNVKGYEDRNRNRKGMYTYSVGEKRYSIGV
jgi:hypothetical protein